jgi:hypothetical protein
MRDELDEFQRIEAWSESFEIKKFLACPRTITSTQVQSRLPFVTPSVLTRGLSSRQHGYSPSSFPLRVIEEFRFQILDYSECAAGCNIGRRWQILKLPIVLRSLCIITVVEFDVTKQVSRFIKKVILSEL